MSALLHLLASLALRQGHPAPSPDTLPDASALQLYSEMLADVQQIRAAPRAVPVYLGLQTAPLPCSMNCPSLDSAEVQRHDRVVRRLTAEPLVRGICERRRSQEAPCGRAESFYVEVGAVFELRPDARLEVPQPPWGSDEWPGAPGAEIPVDFAADLFVLIPCAAWVDPAECTGPDTRMYRYFFRREADGSLPIVARVQTGAV